MSDPSTRRSAPSSDPRDASGTKAKSPQTLERERSSPASTGQARTPRRITVRDHQYFRETGEPPHLGDEDLDGYADVMLDHPPALRPEGEAARVLAILDELEEGGPE